MHLRSNATELEHADESTRRTEEQQGDARADDRARAAVSAGAVHAADTGAAASLQRMAGNAAVAGVLQRKSGDEHDGLDGSSVASTISGGGRPLDEKTQESMGSAFATDFSGVRVHDDSNAHASTQALNAKAYTVGSDIVVSRDVNVGSPEGQQLIAHELTHVVQQGAGQVDGTPAAGGVSVSSPSDRFEQEAEANAERVTSGGRAEVASAGISASSGGPTAQRETADDEAAEAGAPAPAQDAGGPTEEGE